MSSDNAPAVEFDQGRHPRAKIGYIVLAAEETVEDDVFALTPAGVGAHFSRIVSHDDIKLESIDAMKKTLEDSANLLLPEYDIDVICFTCSGATFVLGDDTVCAMLNGVKPTPKATTVVGAAVRALRAVDASRISVLTPYPEILDDYVTDHLRKAGFDIARFESLRLQTNAELNVVSPQSLLEYAKYLDQEDVDAIYICCGALRALDIVGELEQLIGKPVICSNQAMVWDCLRQAGIEDNVEGYGRLFDLPGSDAAHDYSKAS